MIKTRLVQFCVVKHGGDPFKHHGSLIPRIQSLYSGHLQSSGLLQGCAALQPGLIQFKFSFLQLGQGLLDRRCRTMTRADQTQTKLLDRAHALHPGVYLGLRKGAGLNVDVSG